MSTVPKRKNLAAGFLAVAVHGFFVLLLVLGVSWQIHDPQPVMAELWQAMPAPPRPALPLPPPPPEPAPQPKTPPPEPRPVPENKPADIGLEKKKQQELLKQKEAQALQKKREEEKRREDAKREMEKKEAARKEAEKIAEQKHALQREEEDLRRHTLAEALASEDSQREASAAAARRATEIQSLVARYKAMIRDKIRGNTRLPENLPGNPEAEFQLSVLPTGEITKVQLTRSSGNAAYDQAVQRGIEKSSPLPLPTDRAAMEEFRVLGIKHKARE